jgi:hypothetical protein
MRWLRQRCLLPPLRSDPAGLKVLTGKDPGVGVQKGVRSAKIRFGAAIWTDSFVSLDSWKMIDAVREGLAAGNLFNSGMSLDRSRSPRTTATSI